MSKMRRGRVICVVCGQKSRQLRIISVSAFGSPDLDTRPPKTARWTIDAWIQRCPHCGYCASDLSENRRNAKRSIATTKYKAQLCNPRNHKLANSFLCKAIIDEASNDLSAATWALINAAWTCDDKDQTDEATECRAKAAAMFEKAEQAGQGVAKKDGTNILILADLFRRSGQIEKAMLIGNKIDPQLLKKRIRRLLDIQTKLAQRGDRSCYTVADALWQNVILSKTDLLSTVFVKTYNKHGAIIRRVGCRRSIRELIPATVVILAYNKKGRLIDQGIGFIVDQSGDIITTKALFDEAPRAEVRTQDGKHHSIDKVIAGDRESDIIKISASMDKVSAPLPPIISSVPKVGDRVAVMCAEFRAGTSVSYGNVSAVRNVPVLGNIFKIDGRIDSNSIGSPVVNMQGKVFGILTSGYFAVPAKRISMLEEQERKTFIKWRREQKEKWSNSALKDYYAGLDGVLGGHFEWALSYFVSAVKKDPFNAKAYFHIGICQGEIGRMIGAILAFKEAVRLKPNLTAAYYNLGITYNDLKRYTEAIDSFNQAIRLKPNFADAKYQLEVAYGKLGRSAEAMELSEEHKSD